VLAAHYSEGGNGDNNGDKGPVPPSVEGLSHQTGLSKKEIEDWIRDASRRIAKRLGIEPDEDGAPGEGAEFSSLFKGVGHAAMAVEHMVTGFAAKSGNSVTKDAVDIGVPVAGAAIVGGIVAASIDAAGVGAMVAAFF
jgi:hypothetical protein